MNADRHPRDVSPYTSPIDRIPPNSIEAEMALLGCVLGDTSLMPRVAAIVKPDDFYASLHQTVYAAIRALYERDDPVDRISVAEELRRRGMLDKVGGLAFLSSLYDVVPTAASAEYYAKIVAEKSRLRGLIALGAQITAAGYDGEADADAAVAESFRDMQAFVDGTLPTSRHPMSLVQASVDLELAIESGSGTFLPTPFARLTRNIGGWKKGGLYILAGAPKQGKSFLANTCAFHLAGQGVGSVALFALEIGRRETILRGEQLFGGIIGDRPALDSLKRAQGVPLTERQLEHLSSAREQMRGYPVQIFDSYPPFTTDEVIVACRRLASDGPVAGVFVDHIGFLRDVTTPTKGSTKHERIEGALHKLLGLAKQLECPVFLVWHVNREAKDGVPTIFDLRDGGNVEGIAQTILFVRRPNWDKPEGFREGEIIIGATRMGHHGMVRAHFDERRGVWCDADEYCFLDTRPEQGEFDYADSDDLTHSPFD